MPLFAEGSGGGIKKVGGAGRKGPGAATLPAPKTAVWSWAKVALR